MNRIKKTPFLQIYGLAVFVEQKFGDITQIMLHHLSLSFISSMKDI